MKTWIIRWRDDTRMDGMGWDEWYSMRMDGWMNGMEFEFGIGINIGIIGIVGCKQIHA